VQHTTSAFIASLVGPVMVVNGAGILLNRRGYQEMIAGAARNPAVIYLAGILALIAGLVIVQVHNHWIAGWPVLVTIIGWLSIVGGIARIVLPARMAEFGERVVSRDSFMVGGAILSLLIGGLLTIKGYGLAP
jgi:fatty acid desaturase